MKLKYIIILLPVYNDWDSALLLLRAFIELKKQHNIEFEIIIVNDESAVAYQDEFSSLPIKWQIIHLKRNVGHQKAIALGLSYIFDTKMEASNWENIIVMDSDGEDKPSDIPKLLEKSSEQSEKKVVFAHRAKRSESYIFKLAYFYYKVLFFILTGKKISFGNFSSIPRVLLKKIICLPEIFSHYSGGILKSKIPYTIIPTERGKRLAGKSKMNLSSLVLHGLSAIAVYSEMVALRLIFISFSLTIFAILIIIIVVYIKLFTQFATPGWATTIISGALVIITQIFFTSLSFLFLILTYRSQNPIYPLSIYKDFIDSVEVSNDNY